MEEELREKLEKYNQKHVLNFWEELTCEEKELLENQIRKIDFKLVNKLYEETKTSPKLEKDIIEPMKYTDKYKLTKEKREYYEKIGDKIIADGEYAVATMAGGQGTRLGHKGPKGTYELINGKSLFVLLCDTLKKANEKYNVVLPWYIMTSKENNKDTVDFFEANNYFEYPKESVKFFTQGQLPMIDMQGKVILETKGKIKEAADGNGGIFKSMIESGILEDMQQRGVKWLFIGAIDNALLKMVDNLLVGITQDEGMQAASKTVAKANPYERVGVFCKRNGKPSVIEYTELPEEMAIKRDEEGELYFGESHIMCNLFNISVLEQIGKEKLPYHQAIKKSNYIDESGKLQEATEPNCYKFESFIFDAFENLEEIKLLRVRREEEFAPVKNAQGVDSPETARKLYTEYNSKS